MDSLPISTGLGITSPIPHWLTPTVGFTDERLPARTLITSTFSVRPWTIGKYQSYAFAKVWEGTAHLPTQKQMKADYDIGKYHFRGLFASAPAEGKSGPIFCVRSVAKTGDQLSSGNTSLGSTTNRC
jgi:hypothetical protein